MIGTVVEQSGNLYLFKAPEYPTAYAWPAPAGWTVRPRKARLGDRVSQDPLELVGSRAAAVARLEELAGVTS